MSQKDTITSLQFIRGIAAILVLLGHAEALKNNIGFAPPSNIFWFGYVGVDIFFVLSGFVIYYSNYDKSSLLSAKEFLLKRFIRIYPIYWVALAFTLCAFFVAHLVPSLQNNHNSLFVIESGGIKLILLSALLIPCCTPSIISVSWTLGFEIIFYTLFALLFFRKPKYLLMALILWVLSCYIAQYFKIDIDHVARYSMIPFLNPIILEFLYGCLIAILIIKYPPQYGVVAILLSLILFTLSISMIYFRHLHMVPNREFMFGLPATLLIYGLITFRSPFPKVFTYMGDASYSIYLFHPFFMSAVGKTPITYKLIYYLGNAFGSISFYLVIILLCCLVHSYIENPLLIFCKKKLLSHQSKSKPLIKSTLIAEQIYR